MSLSPRDSDFSICLLPGGLDENSGMVRQDAPAGSRTGGGPAIWPARPEDLAAGPPSAGRDKKSEAPAAGLRIMQQGRERGIRGWL